MVEGITCCTALYVALLAEGVDRNQLAGPQIPSTARSPSSRRAWIEIPVGAGASAAGSSPSSRRAWIEILPTGR